MSCYRRDTRDKLQMITYASRIAHISASRQSLRSLGGSTYNIWKSLSLGFSSYRVFSRSEGVPGESQDGTLIVSLVASNYRRELEFLFTQFLLFREILKWRPDALVCQSPVLGGMVGALVARCLRIPLMVEIHGAEFVKRPGRDHKARILQQLSSLVYPHASVIRVLSEGMKRDFLERNRSTSEKRILVIPPRVDLDVFHPETQRCSQPALTLVMVGAINENKGQARAIRALAKSASPVHLVLVGDGPGLERCRQAAHENRNAINVTFAGRLDPKGVASILRDADVFLMNSKTEGTPRAMMEAMACGLPVVTTNAGYCRDLVQDGSTGFVLSEQRTEEHLIRLVEMLTSDDQLRHRMGDSAAGYARKHFDARKIYTQYRAAIGEMANANLPRMDGQ